MQNTRRLVDFIMIPQPLMKRTATLRSGDFVEIRTPEEILQTLDVDRTLDQLPFMPEMVEYCGKRFRVAKRVVKTCSYTGIRHEHAAVPG